MKKFAKFYGYVTVVQWLPDITLNQISASFSSYSRITPVSLLENESWFEIVTKVGDIGK
jgi:hypothetical protein